MKKYLIIAIVALVLIGSLTVSIVKADVTPIPVWQGTANADITEPIVIKDSSDVELPSGYVWDAGGILAGESKSMDFYVWNTSTSNDYIVTPTISPSVPDLVITSWTDSGGHWVPYGTWYKFTLTLTGVTVGTGYSFTIGFTRQ